jgi:nucleoside 2-deoxyribosyltransferase
MPERCRGAEMRVYLAGPLGFSEAGTAFHKEKIVAAFTGLNCEILDPWQLAPISRIDKISNMAYGESKRAAWEALNPEIGATNAAAIRECDLVFAVLDGTDVDSGTASEIGYAFALGKKILGYRGDFRLSADNEGSVVNLQVEYFIKRSGGEIIRKIAELPEALRRVGFGPFPIPKRADVAPARAPATGMKSGLQEAAEKSEQNFGAKFIIGLLLTLIVRAALEAVFKEPIQKAGTPWPAPLEWFQLLTFLIMVARFYLGSTRFIDTQPSSQPLPISVTNVVFASLLFGAFYVAGLAVAEPEFYPALVIMHVIDACWFLFGFAYLGMANPADRPGEIKVESTRQIMRIFFGLSLATIGLAGILVALNHYEWIEIVTAKWCFLAGLIALSIFDFVKLKEYYFRHQLWTVHNTA